MVDDASGAALCVFFAAVLLRSCVSLHGYSGEGVPPMYGDFEAQRHWMEVTVNLPPRAWYVHGADNDLQYWGLDYPPVSAYLSWVIGLVARWCGLPELVALHDSRGHEPERRVERAISAAPRLAAPLPGAGTGGPGWRSARRRSTVRGTVRGTRKEHRSQPHDADLSWALRSTTRQVTDAYRRHRKPKAIASSDVVSVALKFRHVSARGSSGSSSAPSSRPAS